MRYIDCFLAPVPRANRARYEAMAKLASAVLREHGALAVTECWLDDTGADASTYHGADARRDAAFYATFLHAAGAGEADTVVLSWVEWPDKAARDAGMDKVTHDARMQFTGQPAAFDGARLIAGGFLPMLHDSSDPTPG